MVDNQIFEQTFRKVEPESFLYEFLNSGDPLYFHMGRVPTHSFMLSFLAYQATFDQFQNVNLKCNL